MTTLKTHTNINLPITKVSDYLFNLKYSKHWFKNVSYVNFFSSKQITKGAYLYFYSKPFKKQFTNIYRIAEFEIGKKLRITTENRYNFETTFYLEKISEIETKISIQNKGKLKGVLIFFEPIALAKLFFRTRKDLANIKTILEYHHN